MSKVGELVIPQFKERDIFWTNSNEKHSDEVQNSFRGILRLSPNDDGTLEERNSANLYNDSELLDVYYEDTVETAFHSQFVRASSSDGYLIDLRVTQNYLEFDNLNVIGPSFQSKLRVYTKNEESIVIDKTTCLPSLVNDKAKLGNDTSIAADYLDPSVTANADDTYILINRSNDKRVFEYAQVRSMIEEIANESLIDYQTVPTGAIQYVPIDMEQYNKMIAVGKPNNYYRKDSGDANDPITRDYLVCDGSLYRNEDFPELAKVLRGETIKYWVLEGGKMVEKEHVNDYNKTGKYFRVPDLRRMFIKSVFIPDTKDLVDQPWSTTGTWMCDNRPQFEKGRQVQDHRHFVTSAHYQDNPNMDSFPQVAVKNTATGEWQLGATVNDANPKPGVLSPKNNMNMWKFSTFGQWYGVGNYGWACVNELVPSNPCGYFLSYPEEYDFQTMSHEANVGLSSEDISTFATNVTTDEQLSYNNRTEYVKFVGTNAMNSYGYENVPEYVAMLPLIHI